MKTVQSMLAEAQAAVPMISPQEAQALVGKAESLEFIWHHGRRL